MSLGWRIRQLRHERGMSQEQLAKIVQVERSYISHIESGRTQMPTRNILVSIARALETNTEQLLIAAGYLAPPQSKLRGNPTPQQMIRELEAAMPILVPETRQPASAGAGIDAEAEYWPYWPAPENRRHDFIAVEVQGDCMEPRIRKGQRVIVDRTASPSPGDIVLAICQGQVVVKELKNQNGRLVLAALQGPPPVEVTEDTRILGVVRMVMHRP